MTLPNITIASWELAQDLLGSSVGGKFQHVVSINNPGERPPRSLRDHPGRHLVLHFHDITDPPSPDGFTPPSRDDVRAVLDFARDIEEGHDVLVHCGAGISRSSAAALAIVASKLEPTPANATRAVRQVLDAKKEIYPNRNMVADIDRLLGYEGALLDAHATIFAGAELIWMPPELATLEPDDFE